MSRWTIVIESDRIAVVVNLSKTSRNDCRNPGPNRVSARTSYIHNRGGGGGGRSDIAINGCYTHPASILTKTTHITIHWERNTDRRYLSLDRLLSISTLFGMHFNITKDKPCHRKGI